MSDVYLWLLLTAIIGFIILSGTILKWHPFISLIVSALAFGLLAGMPVVNVIQALTTGFGNLVGAIGLIVVLGSILGTMLEESGSVAVLGTELLKRSSRNPSLGIALLGMILGVPVFCDSGFIILVSLAKSISASGNVALPSMTLGLASGLYTTHTMVPPTPGPVAAAGNFGITGALGMVMMLGILVSIPVVLVAHLYARKAGPTIQVKSGETAITTFDGGSLRSAMLLILLPVMLIALASVLSLMNYSGTWVDVLLFIGHPIIALLLTVFIGLNLFKTHNKSRAWIEKGIYQAGPILLLTGCGGALGGVLKESALAENIRELAQSQSVAGMGFLLTGFLIAALFKTAQGSSTSAIVIVSSLLAPLAATAGFSDEISLSLLVLAVGAGAMTVSHANDSYFWVVSQFSGFDLKSGYKGITVMTLLQGITGLLMVFFLYWLLV